MDIPDSDARYYRMREMQERERAAEAKLREARIVHLILAHKYRSHAEDAELSEARSMKNETPYGQSASQPL